MTTIATTEPSTLRAGDTWQWKREDLVDYPAPTWTLKYRFRHPTLAGFEVVSAADGVAHLVTVAASATALHYAGTTSQQFGWVAWVESGAERHTVDSGTVTVLPDIAGQASASATTDTRSHARKMLAAIESLLEGRSTADVQQYTIGSRQITKMTPEELLKWRSLYQREVQAEDAANAMAAGMGTGYRVQVRL